MLYLSYVATITQGRYTEGGTSQAVCAEAFTCKKRHQAPLVGRIARMTEQEAYGLCSQAPHIAGMAVA